jgi:CubicO group peptidase (beta-lactamase class C family)
MNRIAAAATLLLLVSQGLGQATTTATAPPPEEAGSSGAPSFPGMDALMAEYFTDDAPGAAVRVTQGNKVVYERAMGMADLATQQPLTLEHQFRIGSITKQFTAVGILQLAVAGKLKLSDEIQQYVNFPKKEQPITIEHLLSHTSGIRNFTDLPTYTPEAYAQDVSLTSIISQFADLPLEFAPGSLWNYSNSGYILLTAILEKASGQKWEDYAKEHLFAPAGMTQTSASSDKKPLPKEATGYAEAEKGWQPAHPISLTWPLGAGNIRTTVGDLVKWNTAVFAGKLLAPKQLARATQPYRLTDGSTVPYGYGWALQNVQRSPTVEHGGGIDGFVSSAIYLPQEELYVVVLANRESNIGQLAAKLAALALGKPYGGVPVQLDANAVAEYAGVYVNDKGVERYITTEGGSLHSQRQGSERFDLYCIGQDQFIYSGELTSLTFERTNGTVSGGRFLSRNGEEQLTRSDKPLPAPRTEITLSNADLQTYVGEYELMPGMTMTFRADGDRFFVQPTGNEEVEVFGEGPHKFFLKVVDATMEFHPEADGTVKRMTYTQGEKMEGKRIK